MRAAAHRRISCAISPVVGWRVGLWTAKPGQVLVPRLVSWLAGQQGAEETRRGGEVGAPSGSDNDLDVEVRVVDVGVELVRGDRVQAGPVAQVVEEPDEVVVL